MAGELEVLIEATNSAKSAFESLLKDLAKVAESVKAIGNAGGLEKSTKALKENQAQAEKNVSTTKNLAAVTQQLGKSYDSLTDLVYKAAGGFVAFAAVATLKGIADAAARVQILEQVLQTVATSAGVFTEDLRRTEQELLNLGITAAATKESLIAFTQAGLPTDKLQALARAAKDLAARSGRGESDVFRDLTRSVELMQPRLLKSLNVLVDVTKAEKAYREETKNLTGELTQREAQEALLNGILRETARIQGASAAATNLVAAQQNNLDEEMEKLKVTMGEQLLPAYLAIVQQMLLFLENARQITEEMGGTGDAAQSLGNDIKALAIVVRNIAEFVFRWKTELIGLGLAIVVLKNLAVIIPVVTAFAAAGFTAAGAIATLSAVALPLIAIIAALAIGIGFLVVKMNGVTGETEDATEAFKEMGQAGKEANLETAAATDENRKKLQELNAKLRENRKLQSEIEAARFARTTGPIRRSQEERLAFLRKEREELQKQKQEIVSPTQDPEVVRRNAAERSAAAAKDKIDAARRSLGVDESKFQTRGDGLFSTNLLAAQESATLLIAAATAQVGTAASAANVSVKELARGFDAFSAGGKTQDDLKLLDQVLKDVRANKDLPENVRAAAERAIAIGRRNTRDAILAEDAKLRSEREARARALADAEVQRETQKQQQILNVLQAAAAEQEDLYKRGQTTINEFYGSKRAVEEQSLARERAAIEATIRAKEEEYRTRRAGGALESELLGLQNQIATKRDELLNKEATARQNILKIQRDQLEAERGLRQLQDRAAEALAAARGDSSVGVRGDIRRRLEDDQRAIPGNTEAANRARGQLAEAARIQTDIVELQREETRLENEKEGVDRRQAALDRQNEARLLTRNEYETQSREIASDRVAAEQAILENLRQQIALRPEDLDLQRKSAEQEERVAEARQEALISFREYADGVNRALESASQNFIEGLLDGAKSFNDILKDVMISFLRELNRLAAAELTKSVFQGTDVAGGVIKFIGGLFSAGSGTSVPASNRMAEGGPVVGPGTGTSDSIPAMLSNGEFVMPAVATQMFLPLLEAMRTGSLAGLFGSRFSGSISVPRGRGYAAGGYVEGTASSDKKGDMTVNISFNGSNPSVTGNSEQSVDFGKQIAKIVQQEMLKQKRPGGMLATS